MHSITCPTTGHLSNRILDPNKLRSQAENEGKTINRAPIYIMSPCYFIPVHVIIQKHVADLAGHH